MNEFTKEELQDIVDMTNNINKGAQGHGLELHFDLRDKIQSMIDNYCEYEWGEDPNNKHGCMCIECEQKIS